MSTAQEIDFSKLSSKYGVSVTELYPADDFSFGTVLQNEGLKSIDLSNAKVIAIEGYKFLDVIVEIVAPEHLLLGTDLSCNEAGSNCIPFTLQAAYTNQGSNDIGQAVTIPINSNYSVIKIPIKNRGNLPPGPPPTPDYEGFNPSLFNSTVYLYLYGSITVGQIDAGIYSGSISITVTYD